MLLPAPRLLKLLGAAWLVALAFAWSGRFLAFGIAAGVAGLICLVDALNGLRIAPVAVRRVAPRNLALGVPRDIELQFVTERERVVLDFVDEAPAGLGADDLIQSITLGRGQVARATYCVKPVRRGAFSFGKVAVRIASPLGLWQRRTRLAADDQVRVYPNYQAVASYALLAIDHRLSQIGVLRRRRRGIGADFHQLRDYREGDSQRQVDWKATSRAGRLISREYQDERDQQIMLMIDCGRRMGATDDATGVTHLDHALDAALLLAHVALRQGDAVGVLAFGGQSRYMAPQKSLGALHVLLDQVFDLQPTLVATDYQSAAADLMLRLRKRALVVVLANLRDEDDDTLEPALRLLEQRHLVLLGSLREVALGRQLEQPVERLDEALTHAATADYLERRERTFRALAHGGAICLDVEPRMLAISLVNGYLDIKKEARL